MRKLTRQLVVVHTLDGQSLRGLVEGVHSDCVVLSHAAALRDDGQPVPIDGGAVIPRIHVAWVQHLPEGATP